MFSKIFTKLYSKLSFKSRIALATSVFALAYSKMNSTISLNVPDEKSKSNEQKMYELEKKLKEEIEEYIKQLKEVDVCPREDIKNNEKVMVTVKDSFGNPYEILVLRTEGKLYAISATCPYREPFDSNQEKPTLKGAVFFNDKLYCPHHGCVFNISSGSVEHGPCIQNLPIFKVDEKTSLIKLTYPSVIPTGVYHDYAIRDPQDLRKVVIMGGDDHATVGCITALRRYQFQGEITVIKDDPSFGQPLQEQYLHKSIFNLNLDKKAIYERQRKQKQDSEDLFIALGIDINPNKKTQKLKSNKDIVLETLPIIKPKGSKKKVEEEINDLIDEKIYKILNFFPEGWYEAHGIDFIYTSEAFRVINKRFYPFLAFVNGTKLEFDGLLISTGVVSNIPALETITVVKANDKTGSVSQNVFAPVRSKVEHGKLTKFLNRFDIQSVLVYGLNLQSLEFVENIMKEFPQTKITVIDQQATLSTVEIFGPDISEKILKQFTSRGVEFYIKLQDTPRFTNKFKTDQVEEQNLKSNNKKQNKDNDAADYLQKYQKSIEVRLTQDVRFHTDCVVLFPKDYNGNTRNAKKGKYTDYFFSNNDLLEGNQFQKTENIRIFTAGSCSYSQYFLVNKKVWTMNPMMAFEQGYISGLNMQALRIPFYYIPFEKFNFFGKKIYYLGVRSYYNQMAVIGSIENWDFIAVYANENTITAASATQSKTRQLNILREALRINCAPQFEDVISGYWTIPNLANLIRKLNKSGCYKDLILQNIDSVNKKDLIWMERTANAGFQNDKPFQPEEYPSFEVGENGLLKEL